MDVMNVHAVISEAQRGDPEAFESLVRQFHRKIQYHAWRFFAPGSDRDDLMQEAMIGFFKAVHDFRADKGSFSGFVDLCVCRQMIM
jgi:RNA polymerase sporulation-specific sigma factor